MDWLIENVLFLPFLVGPIFMVTAAICYLFPPKKINYLYGYRTGSSMKSQERWNFAQRFSSVKMFQAGAVIFALSFLGVIFPDSDAIQFWVGIPVLLSSCVFLFFTTERALRKKFPIE